MIGFRATVSYPKFLLHEESKHLLFHASARWQEVLLFGEMPTHKQARLPLL